MTSSTPPLPADTPPVVSHPAQVAESNKRPAIPESWKNVAGYAAAVCLTVLLTTAALRLWRADLHVPLFDDQDNLLAQTLIQNTLETGWFLDNPRLGTPGALNLRDYPLADVLHVGAFKLLGYVSHNAALILNLYDLLAFPLTALSAYFVLRRFRLGRLAALVPAVLYACAPYHLVRIRCHPFLSAYYLLPLMIWVVLRVYLGRNPFLRADPDGGRPRWRLLSWEAGGAALLCILTGLAGVYYAFFSCFLLLMAAIKAAFRERRWTPLAASALLLLFIAASVGAALAPSIVHMARYGKNPAVAERQPAEADLFGLNVSEMLLPVQGHRIPYLAELRMRYLAVPRPEAGSAPFMALGFLASLGFVYLAGRFFWRRRDRAERIDDGLAYLNASAVVLGAIGGVGASFAFYVSPSIRCYDRLSILVAFFALAGLFLALQRLAGRYVKGPRTFAAYAVALGGLLLLGTLDQTSAFDIPPHAENRKQYASDVDFGRRIEAALPAGSMVYEMPYIAFPESAPVVNLGGCDLLRPFLHTRTLRWSFGAMVGRDTSRWQADVAALPLPDAVERLAFAGFRGIYLDRAGYADRGASVEAELTRLLGAEPMVSLNGRQAFFDMTAYVEALRGRCTDEEWAAKTDLALHPIRLTWGGAFSTLEPSSAEGGFRWCGARGELHLVNPGARPRRVALKMNCLGWDKTPAGLVVDGDLFHWESPVSQQAQPLERDLVVPPGEHVLTFACDGPPMPMPPGSREIVFRVADFHMRVEE